MDVIPWDFATAEEIIGLHQAEMVRCDVPWVPPTGGCVERSVGAALNAALYSSDGDPDIIVGTAYLIFYIAKNHCFSDGNKRAAWLAATHQLLKNRLMISSDQSTAAALVERVAVGEDKADSVIEWLSVDGRIIEAP